MQIKSFDDLSKIETIGETIWQATPDQVGRFCPVNEKGRRNGRPLDMSISRIGRISCR
jgi:hypothetical protein